MIDKAPDKVTFEIEGKGTYELLNLQLNIPRLGIVKATELAQMPKLLEHLVNINSGAVVKIADSPKKAPEAPKEKAKKGGN